MKLPESFKVSKAKAQTPLFPNSIARTLGCAAIHFAPTGMTPPDIRHRMTYHRRLKYIPALLQANALPACCRILRVYV